MQPLERGLLTAMRVRGAAAAALLVAVAGVAGELAADVGAWSAGAAALAALYPALIAPGRRFRAWGYAFDADELRIAHGIWTRVETLVPLARVQHLDVSQGPVERACGICRLVLHTAGTMHSRVVLPGLSRATAEAMRDDIRARIAREAA